MVNESENKEGAARRGTRAELARELGVTRPAVTKAINSGRIPKPGADGKMDLDEAVAAWKANTRPGANQTNQPPREKRSPGGQTKYSSARARKEHALAQLAELNLKKRQGLLVEAEAVGAAAISAGALLKTHIENIPVKVAPLLVGQSYEDIYATLERICNEILHEVANDFKRRLDNLSPTINGKPIDGEK